MQAEQAVRGNDGDGAYPIVIDSQDTCLEDARFAANATIEPSGAVRRFLDGYDSAGGGWARRVDGLLILVVLTTTIVHNALTRWILLGTAVVIAGIAIAFWLCRRIVSQAPGLGGQQSNRAFERTHSRVTPLASASVVPRGATAQRGRYTDGHTTHVR